MREFDRKIFKNRRNQPTPVLSQFILRGRRATIRREVDREKRGYVDIYSVALLFLIILIVGLDLLDSLFTMMILDLGGWKANSVVRSVIQFYGDRFWIWKFAIVSVPLILFCIHSKFRIGIIAIGGFCVIKFAVLLYQIFFVINW